MSVVERKGAYQSKAREGVVAGIHIAGPNARKSSVVLLELSKNQTSFLSLYEKIGSVGSLFSDERILNILAGYANLISVAVDCPITEPPCVSCQLPTCPGVVKCDDVTVAMMLASEQQRKRRGAHKLRPLNPQNQRLWDVMYRTSDLSRSMEPTYSANMAPLVVRARTLERRMRAVFPQFTLLETSVPIVLRQLNQLFHADSWHVHYRNFETGRDVRLQILKILASSRAVNLKLNLAEDAMFEIAASVEVFQAFIASAMLAWRACGLAMTPPKFFEDHRGWVEMINSEVINAGA